MLRRLAHNSTASVSSFLALAGHMALCKGSRDRDMQYRYRKHWNNTDRLACLKASIERQSMHQHRRPDIAHAAMLWEPLLALNRAQISAA